MRAFHYMSPETFHYTHPHARRLAAPLALALACASPAAPGAPAADHEPVASAVSSPDAAPPSAPTPERVSSPGLKDILAEPNPEVAPPEPVSCDTSDPPSRSPVPRDSTPPTRPPPPGLVDLRAALPGACFDIRYSTADNFTGAPLPGYGAPGAWLRARPAAALARLQQQLAGDGLSLLVYDAYRPARASRAMVAWAERGGRRRLVDDGYIALRSGHNRGDTVDLTLARAGTCEPLDMGTAWDHFGPESHPRNATGEPLRHRMLLRDHMRAIGFSPYDREWWHFTFTDPGATALDIPYEADEPAPEHPGEPR